MDPITELKKRWRNTLKGLFEDNRPAFDTLSAVKLGGIKVGSWELLVTELFARGKLTLRNDIAEILSMLEDAGCPGYYVAPGTSALSVPLYDLSNSILRLFPSCGKDYLGNGISETIFSSLQAESASHRGKQIWVAIGEARLNNSSNFFFAHSYSGRNGLESFIRRLSTIEYTLSDLKTDLVNHGQGTVAVFLPGSNAKPMNIPDQSLFSIYRLLPTSPTPLHNIDAIWAALDVDNGFGSVWVQFAKSLVSSLPNMIGALFNPDTATKTSFVQALSAHGVTLEMFATLLSTHPSGQGAASLVRAGLVQPQSRISSDQGRSLGGGGAWGLVAPVVQPLDVQQLNVMSGSAKSILITCSTDQEMNAIIAMFKQHQMIIKQAVIVSKQCYQSLITQKPLENTLLTVCLYKSATDTFLGEVDPGLTILAGSVLGRRGMTKLGDLLIDECSDAELHRLLKKANTKPDVVQQWSGLAAKSRPTTTKEWMKESILAFLFGYKEKMVSLKTVFDYMKTIPGFLERFAATYGGGGDVDAKLKEMIRMLKVELVKEVGEAGNLSLTDTARDVIAGYENDLQDYPAPLAMEPVAHLGVCGMTASNPAVDTNLDVIALRKRVAEFNAARVRAGTAESKFVVVRSVNLYADTPTVDAAFTTYGAQIVAAWVYVFLERFGSQVVA